MSRRCKHLKDLIIHGALIAALASVVGGFEAEDFVMASGTVDHGDCPICLSRAMLHSQHDLER